MTGKQLKNAILQLAIQGKLVPQDPTDEPASVLLARIRKEKEQLLKAGKLKKKDLETTPIADEEKPFEIPESWEWVRLKDVFSMQAGKNINASELSQEKNGTHPYLCYGGNGVRGYIGKYNYEGIFPIVGRQGALCGCVNMATGKFQATEHAVVVTTYAQTNEFWAYYFLTASNLNQYATATAQPGLSVANILETFIPLPPIAEQHRIVSKIEELMPLVEEYGAAQEKLNHLNEALPEALKKSILQQAIQGKLVPQDTKDEPASALLAQIRKEKEQLLKAGKLKKKDLATTPIADDEKPFEIPGSWEWVHFEDIAQGLTGKTPERGNQEYWSNVKYPWVSISDMTDYGHVKYTKEAVSEKATKIMRDISTKGSLLMSFKLTVGRTSILDIDAYHNEAIITVKPYIDNSNILRDFLFRFLPLITEDGDTKDAIKGRTLNAKSIASLLIPLPPLAEQRRIVAKIEELMAMVDGMK